MLLLLTSMLDDAMSSSGAHTCTEHQSENIFRLQKINNNSGTCVDRGCQQHFEGDGQCLQLDVGNLVNVTQTYDFNVCSPPDKCTCSSGCYCVCMKRKETCKMNRKCTTIGGSCVPSKEFPPPGTYYAGFQCKGRKRLFHFTNPLQYFHQLGVTQIIRLPDLVSSSHPSLTTHPQGAVLVSEHATTRDAKESQVFVSFLTRQSPRAGRRVVTVRESKAVCALSHLHMVLLLLQLRGCVLPPPLLLPQSLPLLPLLPLQVHLLTLPLILLLPPFLRVRLNAKSEMEKDGRSGRAVCANFSHLFYF